MNSDVEQAGELVSPGLAASEIDRASFTRRGDARRVKHCRNCGTELTGAYCHACGQAGHLHRSLLHLTEEVLHGVLHFETKGWRTLPLLVARPGLLTRRYIDGQRTRYVPPLHMFVQLRETYQLSIFASLWRTMALLCVAGAAFSLFLTFIVTMTLH